MSDAFVMHDIFPVFLNQCVHVCAWPDGRIVDVYSALLLLVVLLLLLLLISIVTVYDVVVIINNSTAWHISCGTFFSVSRSAL